MLRIWCSSDGRFTPFVVLVKSPSGTPCLERFPDAASHQSKISGMTMSCNHEVGRCLLPASGELGRSAGRDDRALKRSTRCVWRRIHLSAIHGGGVSETHAKDFPAARCGMTGTKKEPGGQTGRVLLFEIRRASRWLAAAAHDQTQHAQHAKHEPSRLRHDSSHGERCIADGSDI